jgi:hypothetical protein
VEIRLNQDVSLDPYSLFRGVELWEAWGTFKAPALVLEIPVSLQRLTILRAAIELRNS